MLLVLLDGLHGNVLTLLPIDHAALYAGEAIIFSTVYLTKKQSTQVKANIPCICIFQVLRS